MKSYGRAPTFLSLTGYEQVRSVVAAIAGDRESAERVELVLPETGVCSGGGLLEQEDEVTVEKVGGGCCGPAAPAAGRPVAGTRARRGDPPRPGRGPKKCAGSVIAASTTASAR